MLALIRMGLLAGSRSKVPVLLVWLSVVAIGAAMLASGFSGRQPLTVGLDVGLSGARMVLLLLTLVWVQLLLAQDIERKTLYFMLAYPYTRTQFLVSRFITLSILSGVATVLLGGLLWLAIRLSGGDYAQLSPVSLDYRYALVLVGVWLDLLVVLAFAVLLCSLSTTPFLPFLLGLAFALAARGLGSTLDYLRAEVIAGAIESRWLSSLLEYSHVWLPDLSRLDWRPLALYGLPVDGGMIGMALVMALAYVVTLLTIAVLIFERRNFT